MWRHEHSERMKISEIFIFIWLHSWNLKLIYIFYVNCILLKHSTNFLFISYSKNAVPKNLQWLEHAWINIMLEIMRFIIVIKLPKVWNTQPDAETYMEYRLNSLILLPNLAIGYSSNATGSCKWMPILPLVPILG